MNKSVCIVGLGFVGEHLVESFYHSKNYNVLGFDISQTKINDLKSKYPKCQFTSDETNLQNCDLFCIAVPTLLNSAKNDIDSGPILKVKEMLARVAKTDSTIVIESSVYVGATRKLFSNFLEKGIHVGFSPERVDPGRITPHHTEIPKIVSGLNETSLETITNFYSRVFKCVVPVSSTECAEMCKLYENCFRMINIAYVNEISDLCNKHSINPYEMINASKTKPFGFMPFTPGLGVGGHCIPVNPYYLALGNFKDLPVLHRSVQLMENRPIIKADQIINELQNNSKNPLKILVIGLAFKPGETLITNSPSVDMIKRFLSKGHQVYGYDPLVYNSPNKPTIDVIKSNKWWDTLFENKYTMQWLPPSEFDYTHIESFDKIIIANKQHGIDWKIIKESTNKLNKLVWFINQDTVM